MPYKLPEDQREFWKQRSRKRMRAMANLGLTYRGTPKKRFTKVPLKDQPTDEELDKKALQWLIDNSPTADIKQ